MMLALIIKRILGIDERPAPHAPLEQVTEQAARARERLGKASDQWMREEHHFREDRLPPRPSEVFRVGR